MYLSRSSGTHNLHEFLSHSEETPQPNILVHHHHHHQQQDKINDHSENNKRKSPEVEKADSLNEMDFIPPTKIRSNASISSGQVFLPPPAQQQLNPSHSPFQSPSSTMLHPKSHYNINNYLSHPQISSGFGMASAHSPANRASSSCSPHQSSFHLSSLGIPTPLPTPNPPAKINDETLRWKEKPANFDEDYYTDEQLADDLKNLENVILTLKKVNFFFINFFQKN